MPKSYDETPNDDGLGDDDQDEIDNSVDDAKSKNEEIADKALELIADFVNPPDLPKKGEDQADSPSEEEYNQALDQAAGVHSQPGLERSRAYCLRLLAALPEVYSRSALAMKLADQEIALQASITKRDYIDRELVSNVRRILALAIAGVSVLLCMAAFTYAAFHHATVDLMLNYSKWMLGYAAGTVLVFYFPRIVESLKGKKPSD